MENFHPTLRCHTFSRDLMHKLYVCERSREARSLQLNRNDHRVYASLYVQELKALKQEHYFFSSASVYFNDPHAHDISEATVSSLSFFPVIFLFNPPSLSLTPSFAQTPVRRGANCIAPR